MKSLDYTTRVKCQTILTVVVILFASASAESRAGGLFDTLNALKNGGTANKPQPDASQQKDPLKQTALLPIPPEIQIKLQQIQGLLEQLAELQKQIDLAKHRASDAEVVNSALERSLTEIKGKHGLLIEQNQKLNEELLATRTKLEALRHQGGIPNQDLSLARQELNQYKQALATASDQLSKAQISQVQLKQKIEEKEASLAEITERLRQMKNQQDHIKRDFDEQIAAKEQSRNEISRQLESSQNESAKQLKQLQESLEKEKDLNRQSSQKGIAPSPILERMANAIYRLNIFLVTSLCSLLFIQILFTRDAEQIKPIPILNLNPLAGLLKIVSSIGSMGVAGLFVGIFLYWRFLHT